MAGRRVVLVTCTRGEMGEIVVPEHGHARQPPPPGRDPRRRAGAGDGRPRRHRVGEPGLPRLGHDGPRREPRRADASGRRTSTRPSAGSCSWSARYRPDVMTTYNDFGGYGHPDHIRTHLVAVGAFARAGDPAWYPEQLAPEHGGTGAAGRRGRARAVGAGQALRAGDPGLGPAPRSQERMEAIGERSFWRRPRTPPRSSWRSSRRSRPGCSSRTRRSPPGWTCRRAGPALGRHPGARDPDQRGEPVRALRARRLGGVLVQGGVRPPRAASRRRTTRATCSRGSRTRRRARSAGLGPSTGGGLPHPAAA